MAQPSSSGETSDRSVPLKRKRISTEEDLENQPPTKIQHEDENETLQAFLLETSSPYDSTSDEDVAINVTVMTDTYKSSYNDNEYPGDSLFSPPSLPETGGILSPLENVPRGDSTPHSNKRHLKHDLPDHTPPKRKCPLPGLSWADPADVWNRMCECDIKSWRKRNPNMFTQHPGLQHRMRAILLDWLNEVCEVYKMHRETFHLCVDYVDRYLSNTEDVQKGRLQLVGITCLFIAAKVEEIYPPKIGEFAYVTDGACKQEEILEEEIAILKILSWSITPITINGWLNVYMQLSSEAKGARRRLMSETDTLVNSLRGYTFVFPQYSSMEFASIAQLIDLSVLHVSINIFPYSIVAAAAMAHMFTKDLACRVSGYTWEELTDCYRYLEPLVEALKCEGQSVRIMPHADNDFMSTSCGLTRICPNLNTDDTHRIQVHNISLDLFDKVNQSINDFVDEIRHTVEETPTTSYIGTSPLTPPQSNCPDTPRTNVPTPSTRHPDVVPYVDEAN